MHLVFVLSNCSEACQADRCTQMPCWSLHDACGRGGVASKHRLSWNSCVQVLSSCFVLVFVAGIACASMTVVIFKSYR